MQELGFALSGGVGDGLDEDRSTNEEDIQDGATTSSLSNVLGKEVNATFLSSFADR